MERRNRNSYYLLPSLWKENRVLRGGDTVSSNKEDLISREEVLRIILDKRQEVQDEFDRLSRDNDSFYFENRGLYDAIDETLRELFNEINEDDIE